VQDQREATSIVPLGRPRSHTRVGPISARNSAYQPAGALSYSEISIASSCETQPRPAYQRLRPYDLKDRQDRGKPAIKQKQSIAVGQPNPAPALSLQHDQLLSERRDLRLEPRLRSEGRDQDGQNEPEKPDHPISLRDSPSPTTG